MAPEILPKKAGDFEFVNTLQLSGWSEIHDILTKLRAEAKNYWKRTGRGDYFHY